MMDFLALPQERLIAYQKAKAFLTCVREACISEARLRDQALRAATSTCLNIAEAVGRGGDADKARVFAIARGEVLEAASAVDIAAAAGLCRPQPAQAAGQLAREVYAMLTALIRKLSSASGR